MQSRTRGVRWFVLLGLMVWGGVAVIPQPVRSGCVPPPSHCACIIAAGTLPDAQIIRAEILELSEDGAFFRVQALEGGAGELQIGDEVSLRWRSSSCASPLGTFAIGDEVWGRVTPTQSGESDLIDALLWRDGMIYFEEDEVGFTKTPISESQRNLLLDQSACEQTLVTQGEPCDDTVDNFCSISSLGGR